ncbi:rab11 family-interacting protein 4 isoform X4 [Neodiprion pinetum]|uniref:Rab11 family-interacting protein 4 isoform X4 n=1 Tax=Neodiprion lecontei TaxID=441921 RepID=A0ABM3GI24_NEOLC|nr:rab11 family-interacting protein 4 isoform X4 [Neodiprion pinetum]XP_046599925.1 rab11 family-interacting protein 4 isoform X4 [Neodiprion lecontei]
MVSSRSQTATSAGEDTRSELPYRNYYSASELPTGGGGGTNSGPASLSMSVDIHNLVSSSSAPAAAPCPPSPDPEGPPSVALGASKSDPEEEEESYEGFGYGDGDSPGSSAPSPTRSNPPRDGRSPPCSIGRHSWLRTSLRRTPPSQLYRSSSFNSSGRGSTCDTADEIYSDVSLEDDVLGLSHKVQLLQEQMDALADTRSAGEERYARAKQENATLQARVLMLEEAQRDAETRAEERLQAEQRRHREWAGRLERERQLQLENYAIRLQAAEVESTNLRDEAARLREQLEKARADRAALQEAVEDARRESQEAQEAERKAIAKANEAQSLMQAAREELVARTEDQHRLEELVQEVTRLRARNKSLEECRDELQAAAALQAGRELLMLNPMVKENLNVEASLAAELREGMSQDQTDGQSHAGHGESCTVSEMKQALKEQQEVNTQLRAYIDGILLNIVENHPQLLEVKHGH